MTARISLVLEKARGHRPRLQRRSDPILQLALQFIQFLIEFILAGNHQPHKDEDDGEGQSVRSKREL